MTGWTLTSIRFVALVGMAAAAVGCSNPSAGNLLTSPSEIPDTLASHGGSGTVRYYGAEMTPVSVAAGVTSTFSVTIENCNAGATSVMVPVPAS